MKKYLLEAVVEGRYIRFNREFDSRSSAIDYLYSYYLNHYLPTPVINEEYVIDGNKNAVEYYSDYDNRFRVTSVRI